jgi:GAF domain-containing protein
MQVSAQLESAGSKFTFYQDICEQLYNLLVDERNLVANAANTSALLKQLLPDVNWVGFYFTEGRDLVLGPFQGQTACTRIPFGSGVCGRAAVEARTIIVPDVHQFAGHQFAGHIACDPASRSEIVVPLLNWGKLRGVLDVDSPTLNRFDADDQEGLESVAAVFMASLLSDDMPDLSDEAALSNN